MVQVAVMVTAVVTVMVPAEEHPDHSHAIHGTVRSRCHIIKSCFTSNNQPLGQPMRAIHCWIPSASNSVGHTVGA